MFTETWWPEIEMFRCLRELFKQMQIILSVEYPTCLYQKNKVRLDGVL